MCYSVISPWLLFCSHFKHTENIIFITLHTGSSILFLFLQLVGSGVWMKTAARVGALPRDCRAGPSGLSLAPCGAAVLGQRERCACHQMAVPTDATAAGDSALCDRRRQCRGVAALLSVPRESASDVYDCEAIPFKCSPLIRVSYSRSMVHSTQFVHFLSSHISIGDQQKHSN